jgi:hypothetical protein
MNLAAALFKGPLAYITEKLLQAGRPSQLRTGSNTLQKRPACFGIE